MQVVRILKPPLARNEGGDVIHRAGAVEGDQRDNVFEPVGLELAQHVTHARAFQLEDPDRVAPGQHFVSRLVIERQRGRIKSDAALPEISDGNLEYGQRLQPEEVEFHETGFFDPFHVELGDRHFGPRIAIERHKLIKRAVADHDAGGVGRGVAVQALEPKRDLEHLRDGLVAVALFPQAGLALDGLRKGRRVRRIVRNELAEPVDLSVGHLQHAPHVTQDGAGLELSEGDDLRDLVGSVFLLDVVDHLVAPVLAEVDIEVRHRYAFGIEEPLEQEAETQGIEIGNCQRPGDHRPGARAAARPDRYGTRLRPLDEVGDDEEVTGELHRDDDIKLESEPVPVILLFRALRGAAGVQPDFQPLLRLTPQFGGLVGNLVSSVDGEIGQDRIAGRRSERTAAGNLDRILDRLRQIGKQRGHFPA